MTRMPLLTLMPLLTGLVLAQQPAGSMLGRFPYVAAPSGDPKPPLLNTASALQVLEPLPPLNLPAQLPAEFNTDAGEREVIRLFSEASEQLRKNETEQAVALLKQALTIRPHEVNLQISLADSLYASKRYDEALALYEEILAGDPMHFQCLNNLGWLLATSSDPETRDPARAADLAERARLIRPNSHHMWSTLSMATYELGQYREAEIAIQNALNLAQQSGVGAQVLAGYLIHRDRCVLAREATSLLE